MLSLEICPGSDWSVTSEMFLSWNLMMILCLIQQWICLTGVNLRYSVGPSSKTLESFHGNSFCSNNNNNLKSKRWFERLIVEAQTRNKPETCSEAPAIRSCCYSRLHQLRSGTTWTLWRRGRVTVWQSLTLTVNCLDQLVFAFLFWWFRCYSDSQHVGLFVCCSVIGRVWMWVFIQDGPTWDKYYPDNDVQNWKIHSLILFQLPEKSLVTKIY